MTITVLNAPPVAAGSAAPTETDRLTPVHFTDTSTDPDGRVVAWAWDFESDGIVDSTQQHPVHTYTKLGTKNVTLGVTDDDGATTSSVVAQVKVKNIPPRSGMAGSGAATNEAVYEANRVDSFEPEDASTDADGTVEAWRWTFGDGATSEEQHPSHTYAQLGEYDLALRATDNDGDADTSAAKVRVVNLVPTAAFAVEEEYPMVLVPVAFEDASTDRDGDVVSWSWDFGDGGTSKEQSPSHAFLEGGWHRVTLTVTDDDGGVASLVRDVYVCAPGAETDALLALEGFHVELDACVRVNGVEYPL